MASSGTPERIQMTGATLRVSSPTSWSPSHAGTDRRFKGKDKVETSYLVGPRGDLLVQV